MPQVQKYPGPDAPIVRMIVLETDTPHPDTHATKGSFGDILHSHFQNAGADHDPPLGVDTDQRFVVEEEGGKVPAFEEFEDYQGVLITGSMYDAHGDNPWILKLLDVLKELWQRRPDLHLSGVCFGHQLLNRMLGAEVAPAPSRDWELGHSRIDLSPVGKLLFRTDDDNVYLHQMHQDQVVAPPSPESSKGLLKPGTKVDIWGHSSHTKVQGIYIQGRLFTTQAHLAFDEDMVKRQIQMRVESGGIQDLEHADRAAETAHLEHDGDLIAAAILRFFHGDDDSIE
ncbi:putative glutamine amidotransferase-like protein [Colletotrichum aenigma]|uniref:putative glutamine amidotransferase-like protein n=1 Tax=Colletotrichum aenigma TaxID=1215731 RepID=UPI00187302D5|nr:putative glutamine amidotransferase-like protein [Colletotrichum aenigma]KAF5521686.1 putative glutamine amidotransferase-like protein [Colletotrichum aenigma]